MLLADIRDYVRQRRRASLAEIASHCDCDESAAEGIMAALAARGLVARLSCGGCSGKPGCASSGPAVYGWTGSGEPGATLCLSSFPGTTGQKPAD